MNQPNSVQPIPVNWPKNYQCAPELYSSEIQWPRITIITPSFQQGAYIEDTILSVLNQNYPNLEFIIVDGGSTDETVKILEKYSDKLAWWISEKDKGQSDAINKGLAKATGEIVNWLCSDDMLMPGALFQIAQAFRNPETNIVCGWSRQFSENQDYGLACTTLYKSFPELIYISHICQPATWYRLETLKRFAPINIGLHYAMDSEIWIQYLFTQGRNGIKEIPAILTAYRYHESSKTISLDYKFKEDKVGLIYPVLKCLHAPNFLLNFYQAESRSNFYQKKDLQIIHPEVPQKEILEYYILETISVAKIKKQYLFLIQLILTLFTLNPFRPIYIWKVWFKTKITPKLYQ
jgi:glycosyltransferase involved in cell wall biosynthesis